MPASPENVPAVVTRRPENVHFATTPAVVTTVPVSCVPATIHCTTLGTGRIIPGAPGSAGAAPGRGDGAEGRP